MEIPTLYAIAAIYYPILVAFGIPVNLLSIVILSRGKCGLSQCITRYLVAMAAADFLVVIVDVLLNKINNLYFPLSFLFYTPVCSVRAVLITMTLHSSLWFTVAFTLDRFVAIYCQKLKSTYCTKKTATVVIVALSVFSCSVSIPWYFTFDPHLIRNGSPWYCVFKPSFYTKVAWKVFERLHRVIAPLFGFSLICLSNALIIRHIVCRRWKDSVKAIDSELENRRKCIILLFAISGSFILLWITNVLFSLKWQLSNYNYSDTLVNHARYVVEETGIMAQRLSCCTNTCIYALTQAKFRRDMKKVLIYPFCSIAKLMIKHQDKKRFGCACY